MRYLEIDIIQDDNPVSTLTNGRPYLQDDYAVMLADYIEKGTQCTVACIKFHSKTLKV